MNLYLRYSLRLLMVVLLWKDSYLGNAQDSHRVRFEPFYGKVYKMPKVFLNIGYMPNLESSEPFTEIVFDSLNILPTPDTIPLKHIRMDRSRAFIFQSNAYFPITGKYKFTLASDDGSILWIDDRQIIDNDAEQHLPERSSVQYFETGSYPVKLWYYQGWRYAYRLELEAKLVEPLEPKTLKLTLKDEDLKFEFDSYRLTTIGALKIDSLSEILNDRLVQKIIITGHTDDIGTESYNDTLSLKRANAVMNGIVSRVELGEAKLETIGLGEKLPIASNATAQGRSANRRVEIAIDFKNR